MAPVRAVRTIWIAAGLALGFAVVLAGPVLLLWDAVNSSPWNETTLKAEFQSIGYESGGLVFRYAVHNLTGHAAQFQPALTEIHALQAKDRPSVGYPNVLLPFKVPARGSHVVEVRLELAGFLRGSTGLSSGDQPPPMRNPATPPPATAELSLEDALFDLNGFELVDAANGIHLLLPRGW